MPLYMTQFSYTPEAWAALVKYPQNRADVVRANIEKLGGKLLCFYYSFGEYDGVYISEMPDEVAITAAVLAAVSVGQVKDVKTTILLSGEQLTEATNRVYRELPSAAITGFTRSFLEDLKAAEDDM